jgi:Tfp pilus assembly protein PilO
VIRALARLRDDFGPLGMGALAILIACVAVQIAFVGPLEDKSRHLEEQLSAVARDERPQDTKVFRAASPAARIAAFYQFFDRDERLDESLAKLYGIATASGLELKAAEYRLAASRQRLERYEINLPVSGSYAQIRSFIETALAEIVLTLHRLRK